MIGPDMAYNGVSDNPIDAIVVVMLTIIVLTVYILIEKRNRKKSRTVKDENKDEVEEQKLTFKKRK
ncbi:hypothetical protein PV433_18500 [Paenibacillus sp. GYB004]|uniref:hypothetical protein n=1 Tax=Paenibacillus sp. GYB004 TaxID=2994393 RepID=UPI002F964D5C